MKQKHLKIYNDTHKRLKRLKDNKEKFATYDEILNELLDK